MDQQKKIPMTAQETPPGKNRTKRLKIILIICFFLVISVIAAVLIWSAYISGLRTEMENHLSDTIAHIESGEYSNALIEAEAAMNLAVRLRDNDTINKIDAYMVLTETIIRGNRIFKEEKYKTALDVFYLAFDYVTEINNIYGDEMVLCAIFIKDKITVSEMFITFYELMEQAEIFAGISDYEAAIVKYNEARTIAVALSFNDGIDAADSGIDYMQEQIINAKRREAIEYYEEGDFLLNNKLFEEALLSFNKSLEIFTQIEDHDNILQVKVKIEYTEDMLRKSEAEPPPVDSGIQDDPGTAGEVSANYKHNIDLFFDLKTPIDDQNRSPANQVRMGSGDGTNEGWYNGCGWISAYNALIILGTPQHPADIVEYFEESGGTVLDGMFGTYPNAIENYLESLGYNTGQTLFPGLVTNIDETIKSSKVSILAYAHTSAAHYITVEYREDIAKFVVYNDSSARTRSADLGFQNETNIGAALDSITAFINNTSNILFSFSLITVEN